SKVQSTVPQVPLVSLCEAAFVFFSFLLLSGLFFVVEKVSDDELDSSDDDLEGSISSLFEEESKSCIVDLVSSVFSFICSLAAAEFAGWDRSSAETIEE